MNMKSWQDEWPKTEGFWWFYGWRFSKKGIGDEDRKPELCLVEVLCTPPKDSPMYITHGHFLHKEEKTTGKWQKALVPELPKLEL